MEIDCEGTQHAIHTVGLEERWDPYRRLSVMWIIFQAVFINWRKISGRSMILGIAVTGGIVKLPFDCDTCGEINGRLHLGNL